MEAEESDGPRPEEAAGAGALPPPSEGPAAATGGADDAHADRDAAAHREVAAVLEAVGGESHLDGFNLLGVIANPRGLALTSSFHGRYNSSSGGGSAGAAASPGGGAAAAASAADGSLFAATYQTIESTISQATEQMEYVNALLEDWSRQLLEDPYYGPEEAPPEALLRELPLELRDLDLRGVRDYLAACGAGASAFRGREAERRATLDRSSLLIAEEDDDDDESGAGACAQAQAVAEDIPTIFFRNDFDLTEPETFRELLLVDDGDNDEAGAAAMAASTLHSATDASDDSTSHLMDPDVGSVNEWFLLQPPDAFSGFLDKVEIALLHQVRSKSAAFFDESLRFAQLQEGIQALIQQVEDLSLTTSHLQHDLLNPMETVPIADTQRTDLQRLLLVLDRANDLLVCKSSIAGFLSAQDDATAIEHIQYARKLLAGQIENEEAIELRRLLALRTVNDQLQQFEQLVTTNLRDELVEIFLEWNTSNISSVYAFHNGGSPGKPSQQVHRRVREIIGSLQKCHGLRQLQVSYASRLEDIIRMTVRTTLSEFSSDQSGSSAAGATGMTLDRFLDCLDLMFESILALLNAAASVNEFCSLEGFRFTDDGSESDTIDEIKKDASEDDSGLSSKMPAGPMAPVLTAAAELSTKSISELLRLRKEAHSLVTLEEMKIIWDKCMSFAAQTEALGGYTASNLRSTLLAQAKAFVERKHESNMSALVAALDSERWAQWEVKAERQSAISRLCHGRSVIMTSADEEEKHGHAEKQPQVEIEGRQYKVVWSCLLLVEMIINDIATSIYFPSLASTIVAKVAELLRLFNSRTTHLVLGAGAIHSAARLKSINAKHLSMVTECLGMLMALIPYIRVALMTHLPTKQHLLLSNLDQIKKEYAEHNEKVLNKFVTIIGGIVEHGLAPKIPGVNFDERARFPLLLEDGTVACCIFFDGVSTNVRKMHQVLASLLPPDHLQDVFSRIFAYADKKIPSLFIAAAEQNTSEKSTSTPRASTALFQFPSSPQGKRQLLLEAEAMTKSLNALPGVYPWEFTVVSVLGKHMMYDLYPNASTVPTTLLHESQNDVSDRNGHVDSQEGSEQTVEHGEIPKDGDKYRKETIANDSAMLGQDSSKKESSSSGDPFAAEGARSSDTGISNDTPVLNRDISNTSSSPSDDQIAAEESRAEVTQMA